MLELRNITKDYPCAGETVKALKGIDLSFRKNEFVAILGPSGCGKTTMLNIVGGLDHYTSGDLIINGESTKNFKDRDWDAYRNHSIGFVFQSYNLIPHQSVLRNVELALTLSGVSKKERRERAKKALCDVGLAEQINKRPGEMSGGQMQRVAIARAIVNNPDIILADEPTGALDTETSLQVMDILKEISKDRLVIMVTHNPDLAEKYATRTIKMLDGLITDDSMPLSEEELDALKPETEETPKKKKVKTEKKPTMSLFTSFGLSLKNLFTKKGRTTLTSFAGSIGIIGVALIYAVSQGTTAYIDTVQEDTLSSYPLTLEAQSMDLGSLMETFMGVAESKEQHEKDAVYQKSMIFDLLEAYNSADTIENDLKSFKKYLEEKSNDQTGDAVLAQAVSGVQYTYDFNLLIYTENVDGTIIRSDSTELMQELMIEHLGMDVSSLMAMEERTQSSGQQNMMSMFSMGSSVKTWQEMLAGENGETVSPILTKQYDVVYGAWPQNYNEIVLVLDENNEIDDMALYALGLKSKEDIDLLADAAINGKEIDYKSEKWSYEEICKKEFRTILNADCFKYDKNTNTYIDLRDTDAGLKYLYDNGISLKVTGIIRPNEDAVSSMLTSSIGYTGKLTSYVMENAKDKDAIKAQLENKNTDIFTGLPFDESTGDMTDKEKETYFRDYVSKLDTNKKAELYIAIKSIPDEDTMNKTVEQSVNAMSREEMETSLITTLTEQMGMTESEIEDYVAAMSDDELKDFFTKLAIEGYKAQYAAGVEKQMGGMSKAQLAYMLDAEMKNYTTEQCGIYYDNVLEFAPTDYEKNLSTLGYVDVDSPSTINIYASSFENKDVIEDEINAYNEGVDEMRRIQYTDYIGIMMSSITTIINAITYVLIAFVAVSLVVSSIMIGVITLISVQERTKEIGILRAIGASKKNVSGLFNAETVIIGFVSGLLGVLITYLLCIPINLILHSLTGINTLSAYLPIPVAVILVAISMLLTLISGIIPSRSAAKKDPVVALRTE